MKIKDILSGIPCETCSDERTFGHPPNDDPDNKYVYIDISGTTRCFCKKHMLYSDGDNAAIKYYEEKHDRARYGAKLISEVIIKLCTRQSE